MNLQSTFLSKMIAFYFNFKFDKNIPTKCILKAYFYQKSWPYFSIFNLQYFLSKKGSSLFK